MQDNILDHLSGNYHTAIITTFDFDIKYFDARVLPKLELSNIKNILLFVDAKEFEKSISDINSSYIGKKYNVIPFKMNSSFHPKMVLLLGEDNAKVISGSFNQTRRGYMINQEIYNVFEYDKNNIKNLSIIQSAVKFTKNLALKAEVKDEIIDILKGIYYLDFDSELSDLMFVNSFEESIIDQVKKIIKENINKIEIAVPFYDEELLALKSLESELKCTNINLYIQNGKSTFPIKYNNINNINNNIFKFSKIKTNESENFYHGKVFKFETDENDYVLYGSSNCTLAGLFKSYTKGGNIECNIIAKGEKEEYNYFFNEFIECEKKEFTSFEEEKRETIHYPFKLNTINQIGNELEIIIKASNKPEKVIINDEEIKFDYTDNIIIKISKNIVDTIFDVIIVDQEKHTIKCFYNDYSKIEEYRHSEKKDYKIPEHIINKENIMLADLIDIINCLPVDKAQIEENKEIERIYQAKKSEKEETVENYEIDNEKLLEYAKRYNDNMKIKKIVSHVSDSYFLNLLNEKSNTERKTIGLNHKSESIIIEQKDFNAEEYNDYQCKKLIKKLVDKLLQEDFASSMDYKNYKDSLGLTLSYLDKYQEKFNDKQMLSYSEILEYRYNLLNKLLKKEYNNDLEEQEEKAIIVVTFITVIEMNLYYNDESNENKDKNIEPKTKTILRNLSKYNSIKNYDEEFLIAITILKNRGIEVKEDPIKKLIDDNLNYLNFEQVKKAILDLISGNKELEYEDKKIKMTVETEEMNTALELKKSLKFDKVLKLIKSFSINVEQIKELEFIINGTQNTTIKRIDYNYNIESLKGTRKIYYATHKIEESEYNIIFHR